MVAARAAGLVYKLVYIKKKYFRVFGGNYVANQLFVRYGGVGFGKNLSLCYVAEYIACTAVKIYGDIYAALFYKTDFGNGIARAVYYPALFPKR